MVFNGSILGRTMTRSVREYRSKSPRRQNPTFSHGSGCKNFKPAVITNCPLEQLTMRSVDIFRTVPILDDAHLARGIFHDGTFPEDFFMEPISVVIQPLAVTDHQAAQMLGISLRHFEELRINKQIAPVRFGRSVRFAVSDLVALVEARKDASGMSSGND
jgi:excisionase family DNA binding protein